MQQVISSNEHICIAAKYSVCCPAIHIFADAQLIFTGEFLRSKMARSHVHLVCFFRQHLRNCTEVPHKLYSLWIERCVRGEQPAGEWLVVYRGEPASNHVLDPLLRSIDVRSKNASIRDRAIAGLPVVELIRQPVDFLLLHKSAEVHNVIELRGLVAFLECDLAQTLRRNFLCKDKFIEASEHGKVSSIKHIFNDATNG